MTDLNPEELAAIQRRARERAARGRRYKPEGARLHYCRHCGEELLVEEANEDGFCPPYETNGKVLTRGCREGFEREQAEGLLTRPEWTPETAELAERAAKAMEPPPLDPTKCSECRRPLPPRTGKRGKPRLTCPDPPGEPDPTALPPCSKRRKKRIEDAKKSHHRVIVQTDADTLGIVIDGDLAASLGLVAGRESEQSGSFLDPGLNWHIEELEERLAAGDPSIDKERISKIIRHIKPGPGGQGFGAPRRS